MEYGSWSLKLVIMIKLNNISIRILSTTANQTNIVLVKKFSRWNYVTASIRHRMPYLAVNSTNAILTTAERPEENFFGTIIAKNHTFMPAPWIESVAENPLHIWYWIREAKGILAPSDLARRRCCFDV